MARVQQIMNGTTLPECKHDKYSAHPESTDKIRDLPERSVLQIGYRRMVIRAEFDYIPSPLKESILGYLRSRAALTMQYLPDDSEALQTGTFLAVPDKIRDPTYAYSKNGVDYWRGLSYELRGIANVD